MDGLIVKLDFSKAYDTIDWSCPLHVMECMRLNRTWINWIKVLLETTKMSVLVNGSPTDEFSPQRGIRQGDPLALYLFLMVGEFPSILICKASNIGVCRGISFDFHQNPISFFQYADDTILFIENEDHYIRGMKKVLRLFQAITSLSINFNKSVIYHPSNDNNLIEKGIEILGCQAGKISFIYLGD